MQQEILIPSLQSKITYTIGKMQKTILKLLTKFTKKIFGFILKENHLVML